MKKKAVIYIVCILSIVGILTMCPVTENVSAQDYQYVKLYQHVITETDTESAWMDTIKDNPNSADRIKIAENAIALDWEISYPLTPALQSTLYVKRQTDITIEEWLQSDGTANDVEVHVHMESEDGSMHWAHKGETKDVTTTPTKYTFSYQMGQWDDVSPEDNIQIRVNVQYTGLPRAFYILHSTDYPSGISLPVMNPLNVSTTATVDEDNEKITAQAMVTCPFGSHHIDTTSYTLSWTGPTTPSTVTKTGDTTWVWDYGADDAEGGNYQVSITGSDIQGCSVTSSAASFSVPSSDDDSIGSTVTSPIFLIGIVIVIIIIIAVVIILKRRGS
jgi:hypothetical protein